MLSQSKHLDNETPDRWIEKNGSHHPPILHRFSSDSLQCNLSPPKDSTACVHAIPLNKIAHCNPTCRSHWHSPLHAQLLGRSDEVLARHFKKTTNKRKVKQGEKKDAKKRSAQVEEEREAKRICLQLDEDDNDSVDGLLMEVMEEDCDDTN